MVVEYIRYSVEEDRADAFEQAYRRASALDKSEHCERYEVSRCREDPGSMSFGSSGIPRKGTCPDSDGARSFGASSTRSARSLRTSRRCGTTR